MRKKADPFGNLVFDKSARNMNPHVAMAGGYNDCRSRRNCSTWKFRSRRNCCPRSICKLYRTVGRSELEMGMGVEVRDKIARRAAKEIQNGMIVNLGIGIPSLVPNHLPDDINVMFHAENGIVGMGPTPSKGNEDENLCNAAGLPTSLITGASYFDSCTAFGMIRKGLLDITILGSLQVSENGDLANWIVPGKRVPGIGGAMDLAQKAKRVVVVMNHVDKYGNAKNCFGVYITINFKKMRRFNYYGYGSNGSNAGWTYFTRIDEPIHSGRYKTTYRSGF